MTKAQTGTPRTPLLRQLLTTISNLNRRLMLSMFLQEQFALDNGVMLQSQSEDLTSVAFAGNKYCNRFRWRLSKLRDEVDAVTGSLLDSTLVWLHAAVDAYTNELVRWSEQLLGREFSHDGSGYLEAYGSFLGYGDNCFLDQNQIMTLSYLRFRRNSLMHRGGDASECLLKLVRQSGHTLNTYWRALGRVDSLDFSSRELDALAEGEAIDLFRVTRHVAASLDRLVLDAVTVPTVVRAEHARFDQTSLTGRTPQARRRKFAKRLHMDYCVAAPPAILDELFPPGQ